ncbi:MAG: hypothetical protein ACTHO8_02500 [Solirubrobacterales bacterium]
MRRTATLGIPGLALVATAMLVALAISCARPGRAEAFSFFCPFPFPGDPEYPTDNDPAPPNGVNSCKGKVNDVASPAPPPGSSENVFFDADLPNDAIDPIDEFEPPPEYGPEIEVGPEQDEFPATPVPEEAVGPEKLLYRMLFHVNNPLGSKNPGGEEPAVAYTIDFGLPARLQISPGIVAGPVRAVGSSTGQQFTVTNVSNDTAVTVNAVLLGGADAGSFTTQGCVSVTLQPHSSCTITLTFHPTAPGESRVTVTVSGDDGSKARAKGAETATSNGGKPPCDCSKVTGFANDFRVFPDSTRLGFRLNTAILCTAGSGLGCKGKASLLAPKGMMFVTPPPKGAKGPVREKKMQLACHGHCGKRTTKDETFTLLGINVRNPKLLPSGRGREPPLDLVLQTNCISPSGLLRAPDRKVLKINFKPNGNVDYKHSDLNGDGKFDRGELK